MRGFVADDYKSPWRSGLVLIILLFFATGLFSVGREEMVEERRCLTRRFFEPDCFRLSAGFLSMSLEISMFLILSSSN